MTPVEVESTTREAPDGSSCTSTPITSHRGRSPRTRPGHPKCRQATTPRAASNTNRVGSADRYEMTDPTTIPVPVATLSPTARAFGESTAWTITPITSAAAIVGTTTGLCSSTRNEGAFVTMRSRVSCRLTSAMTRARKRAALSCVVVDRAVSGQLASANNRVGGFGVRAPRYGAHRMSRCKSA